MKLYFHKGYITEVERRFTKYDKNLNAKGMRLKTKIRQLERQLNYQEEGTDLNDLLKADYKYKGEPFNSIDEMIKGMNVIALPPYHTDEEIIRFYENGLLSAESKEYQDLRKKTAQAMREML